MAREFPDSGQVEFSSRVAKADYDEFIGNFPQHGATSWFIRTALREFNKRCRENPTSIDLISEAIKASIEQPFNQ